MQAVILRTCPCPLRALVSLSENQPEAPDSSLSAPDVLDLKAQVRSFESVSAAFGMRLVLTGIDRPQRVIGSETDAGLLRVLQASAMIGRLYGPGSSGEVVLSERFGAGSSAPTLARSAVRCRSTGSRARSWASFSGSSVHSPRAAGFDAGRPARDARVPQGVTMRGEHYLNGIARLRPGATWRRRRRSWTCSPRGSRRRTLPPTRTTGCAPVSPGKDRGEAKRPLWILLGRSGAGPPHRRANVAGLQLAEGGRRRARSGGPRRARASRGSSCARSSSRARPSAGGGALGLFASWWGVKALVALAGPALPRGSEVGIDVGCSSSRWGSPRRPDRRRDRARRCSHRGRTRWPRSAQARRRRVAARAARSLVTGEIAPGRDAARGRAS